MDFLQIRFGYLKLTSATPGLSNLCKLLFKSNIAGIFKIDICRVVGEIKSFSNAKMVVIFTIHAVQANFIRLPDIVVCYPLTNPSIYI